MYIPMHSANMILVLWSCITCEQPPVQNKHDKEAAHGSNLYV